MNISLEKIAPSVAFVMIGGTMITIGGMGYIPSAVYPVSLPDYVKTLLVVLGSLLVVVGPVLVWHEIKVLRGKQSAGINHYGITVEQPRDGYTTKDFQIEVVGTYKNRPPARSLRIFCADATGTKFWPQHFVGKFDETNKKWSGYVHLIDHGEQLILVTIIGESGKALCEYYDRISEKHKIYEPFISLPDDIVKYCEFRVTRQP